MDSIGGKVARGAVWMVASKLLARGLGLISVALLARLLTPQDFGLVAMVTAFIAIIELLQSFGFDVALIQRRDAPREYFDSAWAMNVTLALVCAALIALAAPQMARFYGEPRVEAIAYWLAVSVSIQGFENIGMVVFRKDLAFRAEFYLLLAKKVSAVAVTICTALILHTYWALVIGTLVGRAVGLALSYRFHPFRPRFSFSRAKPLMQFSKWLLLNNMLAVCRERIGDLIVGRMFGAATLGIFNVSMEIASLATTELSAPINRVVFSGYSQWSKATHQLRGNFLKVLGIVFIITIPATIGISAVAEPIVLVMLGERWRDAIDLIGILAFFGMTQALQSNFGYVFIAIGHPGYVTRWAGAMLACETFLALIGASNFGVKGAAIGLLIGGILPMPFVISAMNRTLNLRSRDWLGVAWRPVVAAAAMYVSVRIWLEMVATTFQSMNVLLLLVSAVALGFIIYIFSCYGAWRLIGRPSGPEEIIKRWVLANLKR